MVINAVNDTMNLKPICGVVGIETLPPFNG
jgi:hypothetical protein